MKNQNNLPVRKTIKINLFYIIALQIIAYAYVLFSENPLHPMNQQIDLAVSSFAVENQALVSTKDCADKTCTYYLP